MPQSHTTGQASTPLRRDKEHRSSIGSPFIITSLRLTFDLLSIAPSEWYRFKSIKIQAFNVHYPEILYLSLDVITLTLMSIPVTSGKYL